MTTVRSIFEKMPETFIKEKAVGLNAIVQFDITGEGGGQWYAAIVDGELTVQEGIHPDKQLTLMASAPDYIAISTGEFSDQLAFMTGKIRAKGDLKLAMKMQSIFSR